ncbi:MAG TPA: hypothetical protein VLF39_01615 [Candidatus Saccharimonadales bacterium]|nr:hypothetical protein [Candidatus Saccharimonadales bacterium]
MSTLMAEPSLYRHPQLEIEGVFDINQNEESQPRLAHGQVDVGRVPISYTAGLPEQRIYDGWASFEPGFGGLKSTSRPLRNALSELGLITVTYGPARNDNDNPWTRLTRSQDTHIQTIEAIANDISKNPAIKRTAPDYKTIDFDRQVLIPHSMGGLAAVPYAEKQINNDNHNTSIDAIISLSSAGYGSPSFKQIAHAIPLGVGRAIRDELVPGLKNTDIAINPTNLARIIHYYGRNPGRTIGEALSCLTQDVRPAVKRLGEQGVKTAFIAFENDILIPPNEQISDVVDLYHVMPDSGHSAPQFEPKRVANMIVDSLHQLELTT